MTIMNCQCYPSKCRRTAATAGASLRDKRRTMNSLDIDININIMQQQQLPTGQLYINISQSPFSAASSSSSQQIWRRRAMKCYSFNHYKYVHRSTFLLFLCLLIIPLSNINTVVVAQELTNVPSASLSPSISHSPALSMSSSLPVSASSSSSSGSPSLLTTIASTSTSNGPTRIPNPSDRNFCGTSLAVSFVN